MKKIMTICISLLVWMCVLLCTPSDIYVASTSDTYGENVRWTFDETTNTLTLSGTGAMEGDYYDYDKPWSHFYDLIHYIVIEDGITHICDHAFENAIRLKEVIIPESVTSIGREAFENTGLTHIKLHDGITHIDLNAFQNTRLEEITIPTGVTEIAAGLFRDNSHLKNVNFHNGIKTIGSHAFADCTSLQSVIIPDSVTLIQSSAFENCTVLTEVTLSKNIKLIERACFRNSALREISIPDKVTEIRGSAFEACSSLEKITFGAGLKTFKEGAFYGSENLKEVVVSKNNRTFISDKYGVVYSKDKKILWFIPNGFTGEYTVQDGTKQIKSYAASYCNNLTRIVLPDSVTEIGRLAFYSCVSLRSIEMGNGVQNIGDQSFYGCKSLEILTLPATVTVIENLAFGNCSSLRSIEFLGDRPSFVDFAFASVKADAWFPKGNSTWVNNLPDNVEDITWRQGCAGMHNFVDIEAVEPSCSQEGCEASVHCDTCGFIKVYPIKIPMLSHNYSAWVYITPAGIPEHQHKVSRTCSVCGNEQIEFARNVNASELPEAPVAEPEDTTLDATEDITESTTTDTSEPDAQTKAPVKMDVVFIVVLIFGVCVAGSISYRLFRKRK